MVRWQNKDRLNGLLEWGTFYRIRQGNSLARFGDGELKLIHGEDSLTQVYTEEIGVELRRIMEKSPALVGIPHVFGKRPEYWAGFLSVYPPQLSPHQSYVSSFISRPDEAVDLPLQTLWKDQGVLLVTGGGSLLPKHLADAKHGTVINCSKRDAYSEIDDLEKEIGQTNCLVILCCGATATCLAHRLTLKGIRALDLGFWGKFHA